MIFLFISIFILEDRVIYIKFIMVMFVMVCFVVVMVLVVCISFCNFYVLILIYIEYVFYEYF